MIEFPPAASRPAPRRAVFVDRDGVLIANRDGYVRSPDDIEMIPHADTAVRLLAGAGFAVVVVSNQAVVGKGLISEQQARAVHARVVSLFAANGADLYAGYLCPHTAEAGCACRKPRPGLLVHAAARLGLDLPASYMIGDALSDVEAGLAAGATSLMVRTGRGSWQAELPGAARLLSGRLHEDGLAAAEAITGAVAPR